MAVRSGDGGTWIALPNAMCLDRHVPDFLQCLRCWLPRSFGDPRSTRRPWRLRCLDLSRNSLSDDSVCRVMECLKSLDVRISQLYLAGNCVREGGVTAITQYLWNCPDALSEVDLTDNEVVADPKGPNPGNDVISALLRCLYNHGSYPVIVDAGRDEKHVVPLVLRLSGNFVRHPEKLLKQIRSKGGKDRVRICDAPDPYPNSGQEFLSVFLPDFSRQRGSENGTTVAAQAPPGSMPPPAAKRRRTRSPEPGERKRRRDRGEGERPRRRNGAEATLPPSVAAPSLTPNDVDPEPAAAHSGRDVAEGRSRSRDGPAEPDWGGADEPPEAAAAGAAPAAAATGAGGSSCSSRSPSRSAESRRARAKAASPEPAGIVEGQVIARRAATEDDQRRLQEQVEAHLETMKGLPNEQSMRNMLAEFVVCMAVAGKGIPEIEAELETFLGRHTKSFVEWFQQHLRDHFSEFGQW